MTLVNKFVALWMFAMAVLLSTAAAQAEERPSLLDQIEGVWTATGNSFGETVESKMIWTQTLGGQFYRIDYQIILDSKAARTFTGVGHYKATDESKTSGYWVDNGGDLHPLNVEFKDDAIVTIWGMAGKKQGRTEYRLLDAGKVIVTDWLLTANGWREFNQAEFERKGS